ncbi:GLUG motif-containing protein [Anaerolentibacter hominis]|uniref:GLUG motif-containing protein n=1 Tax=Anaerolentibacter hominis TaxID=3079009 RepID=UPI0031B85C5C
MGEPEAVVDPVAKLFGPVKAMAAEADIVNTEEDTSGTGEGTNVPDTTPTTPDTGDTGTVPQPGEPAEGEGTGTPDVPEVNQPEGPTEGPATEPTDPDVPTEPEAPVDPAPDQKEDTTQPEETAGDEYIRTTAEEVCVGGLIGVSEGESLIQNCYAFVKITKKGNETAAATGGFIGVLKEGGRIENSYATGSVEGAAVLGGFAGINEGGIGACYVSNTLGAGEERGAFAGRYGERASAKECTYDYRMSCGEDKQAQRKGTEELTGIQDSLSGEWHYTEGAYPQLPYFALNEKIEIQKKSKASAIALQLGSGTIEGVEGEIELVREIEGEAIEWSASGDISLTEEGKAVLKSSAEEEGISAPEEGIVYSGVLRAALGAEEKDFSVSALSERLEEERVIRIYNAADWNRYFNDKTPSSVSKMTIELMTDIDFGSITTSYNSKTLPFMGTLKGNGHTISNLQNPLFGYIKDATIKDLRMYWGSRVMSSSTEAHFGYIAKEIIPGKGETLIENVRLQDGNHRFTGKGTTFYRGGFIGYIPGSAQSPVIFRNCELNEYDTDGISNLGGFVGRGSYISFENCKATGHITKGTGKYVGGFAGYLENSNIENCTSEGFSYNLALSGTDYVGGMVGYGKNITITNSTAGMRIDPSRTGKYRGGVAGYLIDSKVDKTNAAQSGKNQGELLVQGGTGYVGGFTGYAERSEFFECNVNKVKITSIGYSVGGFAGNLKDCTVVENCYVTARISIITSNDIPSEVGGFVGYNPKTNIKNCFSQTEIENPVTYTLGGFVGLNGGNIESCYSNSFITGELKVIGLTIGGFCGSNSSGIIKDCYSTGLIEKNLVDSLLRLGGFVGYVRYSQSQTIVNCYSTVRVEDGYSFFGSETDCSDCFVNCYYDKQIAGNLPEGPTDMSGVEGINTRDFLKSDMNGFNNREEWLHTEGYYPELTYFSNSENRGLQTLSQLSVQPLILPEGESSIDLTLQSKITYYPDETGSWRSDPAESMKFQNGVLTIAENEEGLINSARIIYTNEDGYNKYFKINYSSQCTIKSLEDWEFYLGDGVPSENFNRCYNLEFEGGQCDFSTLKNSVGTTDHPFTGIINGNNQKITGLNRPLFNTMSGGTIKDLAIETNIQSTGGETIGTLVSEITGERKGEITNCRVSGSINGKGITGGLIGNANLSKNRVTIDNCKIDLSLAGGQYTGGIVGYDQNTVVIKNSSFTGRVKGESYTGGLIGYSSDHTDVSAKIENSFVHGSIKGGKEYTGGLIGFLKTGLILNCYMDGEVSGTDYVGGTIGCQKGLSTPKILAQQVFSNVVVSGTDYVGGFAGATQGVIKNCFASGSVQGRYMVGGFAGNVSDFGASNMAKLENCYSSCYVEGDTYTGEFAGSPSISASCFTNCYYDIQMSGIKISDTTTSVESGKTTAEMTSANIDGLPGISDQNDIWILESNQYPQLKTFADNSQTRDISKASTTAIFLPEGETVRTLTGPIVIRTNEGTWYGEPEGAILISGQSAEVISSGRTELLYKLGNASRRFVINASGTTIRITSFEEWDKYLGSNATSASMKGSYLLDFSGQTEDFSKLKISAGSEENIPFSGSLDGNNQIITGLTVPLFNYINGGEIKNLSLSGVNIHSNSDDSLGSLVNTIMPSRVSSIINCKVEGRIIHETSGMATGGLIGSIQGVSGKIVHQVVNCSSNTEVKGAINTGGLIGEISSGEIKSSFSGGNISGNTTTGGFIGKAEETTINNSFSFCAVEGRDKTGGLIGEYNGGTISDSYATGSVSGYQYTGGLAGLVASGTIQDTYSAGTVTGSLDTDPVCGGKTGGSFPRCYFDKKITGMDNSIATSYGKTTQEIVEGTGLAGISDDAVNWTLSPGHYPKLVALKSSEASDISTFTITFANSSDTANNVTSDITLWDSDDNWSITPSGSMSIAGGKALPVTGGTAYLQYRKSGIGRDFTLKVTGTVIIISNYADWDQYLGTKATKASLGGNYRLSFGEDGCDFGAMQESCAAKPERAFYGSLDGNKQVIKNLSQPLFGYIAGGKISNLTLEGTVYGSGEQPLGMLTGIIRGSNTVIEECHGKGAVISDITGNDVTGGLIGRIEGLNHTVINCSSETDVSGNNVVGGLVGEFSHGTLENSYASGIVEGNSYLGGLIGCQEEGSSVKNCFAFSDVKGNAYLGGLIGQGNSGSAEYCYASGTVSGKQTIGGFAGSSALTIASCYSTVKTVGTDKTGAFLGEQPGGSVDGCCFDKQISCTEKAVGNSSGTTSIQALLTKEMIGPDGMGSMGEAYAGDSWAKTDKLYPRLKVLKDNETAVISAVSLFLADSLENGSYETLNTVKETIEIPLMSGDYQFIWKEKQRPEKTTINRNEVNFTEGGRYTLSVQLSTGTRSKNFDLMFIGTVVYIHNLQEWEQYLGSGATEETLCADYILDFENKKCDFSELVKSSATTSLTFKGTLDGKEQVISHLARPLFDKILDGTVQNLILEGDITWTTATGISSNMGMLAGTAGNETGVLKIINCHASGSIKVFKGTNNYCSAGGLVGSVECDTSRSNIIKGCTANVKIDSETNSNNGGLLGSIYGGFVQNCFAISNISGYYAGGLIGSAGETKIDNVYATGILKAEYAGGLGYEMYRCIVSNAYASCQLPNAIYRSGFVSTLSGTSTFNNCYYDKDISGTKQAVFNNSNTGSKIEIIGLTTKDLTCADNPEVVFSDASFWDRQEGIYPQLSCFSRKESLVQPASEVSATTIILSSGDEYHTVRHPIQYQKLSCDIIDPSGTFTLTENTGSIREDIIGKKVSSILFSKEKYQKEISMTVIGAPIMIHNLDEWERYLGASASAETLDGVYQLDFADKTADFSALSTSAGTEMFPFTGILLGDNYRIVNLSKPLFGIISSGQIYDLSLEGDIQVTQHNVGMLAKQIITTSENLYGAKIYNCSVTGSVVAPLNNNTYMYGCIGGMVGFIGSQSAGGMDAKTTFFERCYADVEVSASSGGGLVGEAINTDFNECYVNGRINTSGGLGSGGIVGYLHPGTIRNSYAVGYVTGYFNGTGGLVGYLSNSSKLEKWLVNCYSAMRPIGKGDTGALVGRYSNPDQVENCYFDRQITGLELGTGSGPARDNMIPFTTKELAKGSRNNLTGFIDNPVWTIIDGKYPQLTWFAESKDVKTRSQSETSSVPIFLEDEGAEYVKNSFAYENRSGNWSVQGEALTLADGIATPMETGRIILNYVSDSGCRKDYLLDLKGEAILIRNLKEWEKYLGSGADEESLQGVYQLRFAEGVCDFSELSASCGLDEKYPFRGTLLGENQKITGLKKPLFQFITDAEIRDLSIEGHIASSNGSGLLVEKIVDGGACKILNCHTDGSVTGYTASGLIGKLTGAGHLIKECSSSATIKGSSVSAGILGYAQSYSGFTMENCKVTGTIMGLGGYSGGLIALLDGVKAEIKNCYVEADISGTSSINGGLVGAGTNTAGAATIENCYHIGNITGKYAGGLVGRDTYNIKNSYHVGDISAVVSGYAGGLAGYYTGTMSNCFSVGKVSGIYAGGLCGYLKGQSTVTNCYTTCNVEGINTTSYLGGLIGFNSDGSGTSLNRVFNCYAAGKIGLSKTVTNPSILNMGGIIGKSEKSINPENWNNCYYDMQLAGTLKGIGVGSTEEIASAGAKLTTELTGTVAGNLGLEEDVWLFNEHLYPQLRIFSENEKSAVLSEISTVAIYLANDETSEDFKSGFEYYVGNPENWSETMGVIDFLNGRASIKPEYTGPQYSFDIVYRKNGFSRTFCLESQLKEGTITITSLELWEMYLGSNATKASLQADYILDFPSDSCDFSSLSCSAGYISSKIGDFTGTLDGNYQKIIGLKVPLIYSLSGASVKNLLLEGTVAGKGMLSTACTNSTSIINCHVTGVVSDVTNGVGGLLGSATNSTITGCSSNTSVTTSSNTAGGLIGTATNCIVDSCYANGIITGRYEVGGLLGNASKGRVNNCYAVGQARGETMVGGLCGKLSSADSDYNYAVVQIYGDLTKCGGLVGDGAISTKNVYDKQFSNVMKDLGNFSVTIRGKLTNEMINDGLTDFAANGDYWIMTPGAYPQLKLMKENLFTEVQSASRVSSTCIYLSDGETAETAKSPISYDLTLPGNWAGERLDNINLENGTAVLTGKYATLSYQEEDYTRRFALQNPNAEEKVIVIHTLEEWETYLGKDATEETLKASYQLDFTESGGKADFSQLKEGGSLVNSHVFTGTLDGNGQTITSLQVPLFKYILGGTIKNLSAEGNITNTDISTATNTMSMVTDYAIGGSTFRNIHISGSLNNANSKYVGALIGYSAGTDTDHMVLIDNCSSDVTINGTGSNIGGLCGYVINTSFSNSFTCGSITSDKGYIGGIAGYSLKNSTIDNCFTMCSLVNTSVTSSDGGGGLVGCVNDTLTITNCYSAGYIQGQSVGGIIGRISSSSSLNYTSVQNCYTSVCVNGGGDSGSFIGAASQVNSKSVIVNCYSDLQVNGYNRGSANTNISDAVSMKYTQEMTGTVLSGLTAENGWIISEGLYPRLAVFGDTPESIVSAIPIYLYANTEDDWDNANGLTQDFTVPTTIQGKNVTWTSSDDSIAVINPKGESVFKNKTGSFTVKATRDGASREFRLNAIVPIYSTIDYAVTLPAVETADAAWSRADLLANGEITGIADRTFPRYSVSSTDAGFELPQTYTLTDTAAVAANYSTYGTVNANSKLGFALETTTGSEIDLSQALNSPITGVIGIKLYNAAAYNCPDDQYFRIILEVPDDRSVAINVTIPGIQNKRLDITVPVPTQISLQPGIRSKAYTQEWTAQNNTAYPLTLTLAAAAPGEAAGEDGVSLKLITPEIAIRPGEELITEGVKLGLSYTEGDGEEMKETCLYYNPAEGAAQPQMKFGAGRAQNLKYFLEYSPYYTGTKRHFSYQIRYNAGIPEEDVETGGFEVKEPAAEGTSPAE